MEQLPKNISYQKLYEPQNIWFLNWILKQQVCYPYLNQIILSTPFTVERDYCENDLLDGLTVLKNGDRHGLDRLWYKNGKLLLEGYWQNSERHGLDRAWHENGKLKWENNWQNGQMNGLSRGWNESGLLTWENYWKNNDLIFSRNLGMIF